MFFPDEGFETISDQFMLGNDILAAPVATPKTVKRSVKLPRGKWKDDRGTVFDGGVTVSEDTPLTEYFISQNCKFNFKASRSASSACR